MEWYGRAAVVVHASHRAALWAIVSVKYLNQIYVVFVTCIAS